jgi:hypothetical protein
MVLEAVIPAQFPSFRIFPFFMATSPYRHELPVPSSIRPFFIRISAVSCAHAPAEKNIRKRKEQKVFMF